MYERFSDRARQVMQFANQEAQRLNHEYVGTEHILLGLLRVQGGVAQAVLNNLHISLEKAREDVIRIVQTAPDMVTMGKLPLTPRAKKIIEYAAQEAAELRHNYVGTEHLLLGILREQEGIACQVLINLGAKLEEVRETILALLGAKSDADEPLIKTVDGNPEVKRLAVEQPTIHFPEQAKLLSEGPKVQRWNIPTGMTDEVMMGLAVGRYKTIDEAFRGFVKAIYHREEVKSCQGQINTSTAIDEQTAKSRLLELKIVLQIKN